MTVLVLLFVLPMEMYDLFAEDAGILPWVVIQNLMDIKDTPGSMNVLVLIVILERLAARAALRVPFFRPCVRLCIGHA